MLMAEERRIEEGEETPGPAPHALPYAMAEWSGLAHDLSAVLDSFRPDVVVVDGRRRRTWWSRAALRAAAPLPTVLHLHDIGSTALVAEPDLRLTGVVAVSDYVAGLVQDAGGRAEVVPPAIDRASLRAPLSRRVALLVNPVPEKGVDTAIALARARPDVPFAFARCWHPDRRAVASLPGRLGALGNVGVRPCSSTADELYRDARLLLVPSTAPEGFGRVAAEARMCGIPVIASRAGGLSEAAGDRALLVPPQAGTEAWTEAFARVWDDDGEYAHRSRSELRPELQPDVVAARFERCLRSAVERSAAAPV
jgi:glycosyltransferase involved in cell wall biosynthesis